MKLIEIDKYCNVSVSFRSIFPLNRETITKMNLLLLMLRQKTEKYPTKQSLTTALTNNYATKAQASLTSYGNQLLFDFRFQWIRDDWIDDALYISSIKNLVDEVLCHSLLDEQGLKEAKYLLKNRLINQQDDPNSLALQKMFSLLKESHSLSVPVQGILEEVDTISLDEVQALYALMQENPRHIYAVGKMDDELKQFLKQYDSDSLISADYEVFQSDSSYFDSCSMDISQTSIAQLYSTGISIDSMDYYPLLVMNSILGQSPNSLLFQEVREKNSFCYSIYSTLIRFDGVLCITTGTKCSSVPQVLSEIQKQVNVLCEGAFGQVQLDIAKKDLKDRLISGMDHPFTMIEQSYMDDLLGRSISLSERLARIDSVDVDQIQHCAKKLRLVSQFIVEGVNDESL